MKEIRCDLGSFYLLYFILRWSLSAVLEMDAHRHACFLEGLPGLGGTHAWDLDHAGACEGGYIY